MLSKKLFFNAICRVLIQGYLEFVVSAVIAVKSVTFFLTPRLISTTKLKG